MHRIVNKAIGLLREAGIGEVYASFDALPFPVKSDRRFTVVGLDSVQMDAPFPNGGTGVHPFTAMLKVSVLVPMTSPADTAEAFYYETLLPVLHQLGAVPGNTAPPVVDVKLQRLVISGSLRIRGLYLEWDAQEGKLPEDDAPEAEEPEVLV